MGEKMINFNTVIPRKHTNCIKYDFQKEYFGTTNLQPLWIADMDFATPPFITKAMKKRLNHPIYAYTKPNQKFYDAIIYWMKKQHQWKIQKKRYPAQQQCGCIFICNR